MKRKLNIAAQVIIFGLLIFLHACRGGVSSGSGTSPAGAEVQIYNPMWFCTVTGTSDPISYTVTWHVYTFDKSMNTVLYSMGNSTETAGSAYITESMNLPTNNAAYQITVSCESNDCTTCATDCDPTYGGRPHWTAQESWLHPTTGFVPFIGASQFTFDYSDCCP